MVGNDGDVERSGRYDLERWQKYQAGGIGSLKAKPSSGSHEEDF